MHTTCFVPSQWLPGGSVFFIMCVGYKREKELPGLGRDGRREESSIPVILSLSLLFSVSLSLSAFLLPPPCIYMFWRNGTTTTRSTNTPLFARTAHHLPFALRAHCKPAPGVPLSLGLVLPALAGCLELYLPPLCAFVLEAWYSTKLHPPPARRAHREGRASGGRRLVFRFIDILPPVSF